MDIDKFEKNKIKEKKNEKNKDLPKCYLLGEKVIAFDRKEEIYLPGYYGKILDDRIELSLVEALYLLKKGRIEIFLAEKIEEKDKKIKISKKSKKALSFMELYKIACSIDKRFSHRYRVYEDLRDRGLLVKTGFKFGCDFRCYERGVELKRGPKSQKEHTKWVVFCVPEDYTCSFQELSRAVRLAHNIRARMLWAIVDNEGDVTYYEVVRILP
ncbi:MAG: tRNA-intron lyase [Candidatus Aenigmatarchaeota archaeon]